MMVKDPQGLPFLTLWGEGSVGKLGVLLVKNRLDPFRPLLTLE